ncbi:major facilitator superfamily domain-containing protein, partial [Chytridium lagenaria]
SIDPTPLPRSPRLEPESEPIENDEARALWRHLSSFSSVATIDFNPAALKMMFILCTVIFSEPMSMTILCKKSHLYTYVRDFLAAGSNGESDEKQIGYYVGFIASSFSLAQFLTSIFWGWFSDRVGRRPVLLLGLIGNTLTILMFGMSHSLGMAIFSRAACGFLNGNIGVAKCVMGEITDSTNQAKGFSMFGLMWSIGMICGPVLGGFLSNPVTNFPSLFGKCVFLKENPYFLPCLISAIISMIGFVVGFFFFEETSVRKDDDVEAKAPPTHAGEILRSETVNEGSSSGQTRDSVFTQIDVREEAEEEEVKVPKHKTNLKEPLIPFVAFYSILGYGMLSFQNIIFDETFSLWVVTPRRRDIGFCLSLMGCLTLFIQLIVYPYLSRFFSAVKLYQFAVLCYAFIFPIFPAVSMFLANGSATARLWTWPALLLNMACRHFCNVLAFTSVMIMINNSAGKTKLGIVNGIGQTTAAFVRSIGPAVGGIMWAWSLTNHLSFPFNYWFVFFVLSTIAMATSIQSRFIPEAKEPQELDDSNVNLCH